MIKIFYLIAYLFIIDDFVNFEIILQILSKKNMGCKEPIKKTNQIKCTQDMLL